MLLLAEDKIRVMEEDSETERERKAGVWRLD